MNKSRAVFTDIDFLRAVAKATKVRGAMTNAVAEVVGCSTPLVRRRLPDLEAAGLVERAPGPYHGIEWLITDHGKAKLKGQR